MADFADTSAKVVHTAAEVLEKELAAGIKAAQNISTKVETTFQNSPAPTQTSFLEMIDLFERDGQAAVSVLATLLRILSKALDNSTAPTRNRDE
jgi:hypothetical protein